MKDIMFEIFGANNVLMDELYESDFMYRRRILVGGNIYPERLIYCSIQGLKL